MWGSVDYMYFQWKYELSTDLHISGDLLFIAKALYGLPMCRRSWMRPCHWVRWWRHQGVPHHPPIGCLWQTRWRPSGWMTQTGWCVECSSNISASWKVHNLYSLINPFKDFIDFRFKDTFLCFCLKIDLYLGHQTSLTVPTSTLQCNSSQDCSWEKSRR